MISFRYHLVSIVAVFAALTIGIVAGSTVVKNLVLDATERNLERTEAEVQSANARNAQLSDRLNQAGDFIDALPEALLTGRLAGAPVMMVEGPAVGDGVEEGMLETLRTAGAIVVARANLETVATDEDSTLRLAEVLGLPSTDSSTVHQAFGRSLGRQVLTLARAVTKTLEESVAATSTTTTTTILPTSTPVAATAAPAAGESSGAESTSVVVTVADTVPPPETEAAVPSAPSTSPSVVTPDDALATGSIDAFEQAGLLSLEDVASPFVPGSPLIVLVLVDRSTPSDITDVTVGLAGEVVADPSGVKVIVVEAGEVSDDDETTSPSVVAAIRDDSALRKVVSTVDNADLRPGWFAAVLAIEELLGGSNGHYGDHDGSRRLLPIPT